MDLDPADRRALRAAAFLAQALALDDDALALLPDLVAVETRPDVAVYAAELDSSVGPAAFLVYAYQLAATGADGRTGRARLDADLETLREAAARDAPGPRLVAHAVADDAAFILATTPATLRALGGDSPPASVPMPAALDPGDDPAAVRRDAAADLLPLLRTADAQAAAWLAAVQVETAELGPDPRPLSVEETELALFLLDDRSIGNLLRLLRDLIATAQRRPPPDPDRD